MIAGWSFGLFENATIQSYLVELPPKNDITQITTTEEYKIERKNDTVVVSLSGTTKPKENFVWIIVYSNEGYKFLESAYRQFNEKNYDIAKSLFLKAKEFFAGTNNIIKIQEIENMIRKCEEEVFKTLPPELPKTTESPKSTLTQSQVPIQEKRGEESGMHSMEFLIVSTILFVLRKVRRT